MIEGLNNDEIIYDIIYNKKDKNNALSRSSS